MLEEIIKRTVPLYGWELFILIVVQIIALIFILVMSSKASRYRKAYIAEKEVNLSRCIELERKETVITKLMKVVANAKRKSSRYAARKKPDAKA